MKLKDLLKNGYIYKTSKILHDPYVIPYISEINQNFKYKHQKGKPVVKQYLFIKQITILALSLAAGYFTSYSMCSINIFLSKSSPISLISYI